MRSWSFSYTLQNANGLLQLIDVTSEKLLHGIVHRKNTIILDPYEDPLETAVQQATITLYGTRDMMESNRALQLPQNEGSPREYSMLRARLMQVQGIEGHDWRNGLVAVVLVRGRDFLHQ